MSNLLFLSQPVGVGMGFSPLWRWGTADGLGFSYADAEPGSINPFTGGVENASYAGVQGRYPVINATEIGNYLNHRNRIQILMYRADTTASAAHAAWEIVQGFLGGLPDLDSKIKSKSFNLWTESYGG